MKNPNPEAFEKFLPLARLALDGRFDAGAREVWAVPLARLLEAASRGVGQIKVTECGLPDNPPEEFFAVSGDLVLLPRYQSCWDRVRTDFEQRLAAPRPLFDDHAVRAGLDAILPRLKEDHFDNARQRLAVAAFFDAGVGVLTGGPGTGKTTCAAALLALRKRLEPGLEPAAVLVVAPTGKAACRLAESLSKSADRLPLEPAEKEFLKSLSPRTLHKALEWTPKDPEQGGPFARNRERPLDARVVIVDEASMVDLELMAHLVLALPPAATLILLGDSDQLESVETGGVLAELVARGTAGALPPDTLARWQARTGEDTVTKIGGEAAAGTVGVPPASPQSGQDARAPGSLRHSLSRLAAQACALQPLPGLVIALKSSYRAKESPWILELADMVKPGGTGTATQFRALAAAHEPNVRLYDARADFDACCDGHWKMWTQAMSGWTVKNFAEFLPGLGGYLAAFQLLCGSNAQVDRANRRGMRILWGGTPKQAGQPHGCPIIVGTNSHSLGLSNGDIGVALGSGPGTPAQVAVFPGIPQPIPLSRLPEHQPAFALTIHKSQGSEWQAVALDLPGEESRLLGRNLVYTAITRSGDGFHLFAGNNALESLLDDKARIG